MPNHVLRNCNVNVDFSVVNLEFEADEVGEDGCSASHGFDRDNTLARRSANDWKTMARQLLRKGCKR